MKSMMIQHLFLPILLPVFWGAVWAGCNSQSRPSTVVGNPVSKAEKQLGDTVATIGKNIDCIFQDKNGHYWFASNETGVYRYEWNTFSYLADSDLTAKHLYLLVLNRNFTI